MFIRRSVNKTGKATVDTLDKLEEEIPELSKIIESLLLDNGIKFSKIEEMMKSVKDKNKKRFQIYFTHPYASYERGCNENKNRMIRRYFKKEKLVEKLESENQKLRDDSDRLKKQINNNSNNSSKPLSSDIKKSIPNNREKTNKKAGGQKGHKVHFLCKKDVEEKINNKEIEHEIIHVGLYLKNIKQMYNMETT